MLPNRAGFNPLTSPRHPQRGADLFTGPWSVARRGTQCRCQILLDVYQDEMSIRCDDTSSYVVCKCTIRQSGLQHVNPQFLLVSALSFVSFIPHWHIIHARHCHNPYRRCQVQVCQISGGQDMSRHVKTLKIIKVSGIFIDFDGFWDVIFGIFGDHGNLAYLRIWDSNEKQSCGVSIGFLRKTNHFLAWGCPKKTANLHVVFSL